MTSSAPHHLLIGIVLGITVGILLGGFVPEAGIAVEFLGELFLRALFVMVVPLVMSSMIVGVSSLGDVRKLGRIGGRTILFFMTTTGIAVSIGLMLVLAIHPGVSIDAPSSELSSESMSQVTERMEDKPTTLGDLFRTILTKMVPDNLFLAMVNTEVLPLIVFALVFGGVLTTIGEKGTVVIRFFDGVNEAIMAIVHLLMWVAPIGIGALIAGEVRRGWRVCRVLAPTSITRDLCRHGDSRTAHSRAYRTAPGPSDLGETTCRGLCQSDEHSPHDGLFN